MTNYNDGQWHGWSGGECPVHEQSIGNLTYYDGTVYKNVRMSGFDWQQPLLFRVTKEHKEPREFWITANEHGVLCVDSRRCFNAIHVREVIE